MWAWGAFNNWPTVLVMPVVATIALTLYFFARIFRNDDNFPRVAKSIACGAIGAAAMNIAINSMLAGPMEIIIAGWFGLFAIIVSVLLMGFHLLIFRRTR